MNIGFIGARGIPHGYSSAEQVALQVGRRLVSRGHHFTVYCRSNLFQDHTEYYEGVRRLFLPTVEHKVLGQLFHGFVAGGDAVFRNYDVVHFQCLTNTYQSILPRLIRRNIIINVNGQEWDNPKWPKTVRHLFFKSTIHLTLAMCREIITDAQGMYDLYLERYQRPSTIIEYGAEIVEPKNPGILSQYGLSPKEYYFIAARLVPSNQIHIIVDSFNRSKTKRILAVAGGGDYGSEFFHNLKAATGAKVKLLGMISDQSHMNELYANAYGYLHGASLGGVNSALLRPLGAGCPALAFDTPFNREVLQMPDGSMCGTIWRNADELIEGIDMFEKNSAMIANFSALSKRQVRRNFNWDLVADQYELFYRGFIEKWPVQEIRDRVRAAKNKYSLA